MGIKRESLRSLPLNGASYFGSVAFTPSLIRDNHTRITILSRNPSGCRTGFDMSPSIVSMFKRLFIQQSGLECIPPSRRHQPRCCHSIHHDAAIVFGSSDERGMAGGQLKPTNLTGDGEPERGR